MASKTIQQLRTEKGLSEEQFGRMAGLTANDVREWERIGSIHDPVKIGTAAKALGVPWSAILLQPEWSVYAPAGKQLLLYSTPAKWSAIGSRASGCSTKGCRRWSAASICSSCGAMGRRKPRRSQTFNASLTRHF